MSVWKRIGRSRFVHVTGGAALAGFARLVARTTSHTIEPPDIYQRLAGDMPFIYAFWHGQQGLVPIASRPEFRAMALVSRHHDAEINAIALERLGVEPIRGSGDHGHEFHRKGGFRAFREMVGALAKGRSLGLTADVPKVARYCGLGIVKLAQVSGRPIYPLAVTTSRRIEVNSWDRAAINLPFGRLAIVFGDAVSVARDADDDTLEAKRCAVEDGLNAATARAYALVDRKEAAGG